MSPEPSDFTSKAPGFFGPTGGGSGSFSPSVSQHRPRLAADYEDAGGRCAGQAQPGGAERSSSFRRRRRRLRAESRQRPPVPGCRRGSLRHAARAYSTCSGCRHASTPRRGGDIVADQQRHRRDQRVAAESALSRSSAMLFLAGSVSVWCGSTWRLFRRSRRCRSAWGARALPPRPRLRTMDLRGGTEIGSFRSKRCRQCARS